MLRRAAIKLGTRFVGQREEFGPAFEAVPELGNGRETPGGWQAQEFIEVRVRTCSREWRRCQLMRQGRVVTVRPRETRAGRRRRGRRVA
jgi:hypothetical protein